MDIHQQNVVALILDQDQTCREQLIALLQNLGFESIVTDDADQAISLFESSSPDIAFINADNPQGFDVCGYIKAMTSEQFIPVVFLTSPENDSTHAKCIEAGGDDFIHKPYNPELLKSKILAIERIRNLHREISSLYQQSQRDEEVAEQVFRRVVGTANIAQDSLNHLLRPAGIFSGDIMLSSYTAAGDLDIMLGDFTGHGLSAALGAMPTAEIFRAMTSKGFSVSHVLKSINHKLYELLPTRMFMATQYVRIHRDLSHVTICNCGMPDILVIDNKTHEIKHRIASQGLPLGITGQYTTNSAINQFNLDVNDRILLASDGVVEARNPPGEEFTQARLEAAISQAPQGEIISNIVNALDDFCSIAPQDDDISLIEIPFNDDLLCSTESIRPVESSQVEAESGSPSPIEISLKLQGQQLNSVDPVPMLLSQINDLTGRRTNPPSLFFILHVLYNNALEHGILDLSFSNKYDAQSHTEYLNEKAQKLESLNDGYIKFTITIDNVGRIDIMVEDSGTGFNISQLDSYIENSRNLYRLVEACTRVVYCEPGNKVLVTYQL